MSDLELFLLKGASCEENETCFLHKRVSYTREHTVSEILKVYWLHGFKSYYEIGEPCDLPFYAVEFFNICNAKILNFGSVGPTRFLIWSSNFEAISQVPPVGDCYWYMTGGRAQHIFEDPKVY